MPTDTIRTTATRRRRRVASALAGTLALSAAGAIAASTANAAEVTGYRITITNLTDGQPLTPPVVALHDETARVFARGEDASNGVRQIAENGDNAPLVAALDGAAGVFASQVAGDGPLVPSGAAAADMFGDTVTIEVGAAEGATQLSLVSMLVCTNDGFAGIDSLDLPTEGGQVVTATGRSYDAGTEQNTEDFANLVPPCQALIGVSSADAGVGASEPALLTDDGIQLHPGVAGGDDLVPALHGWTDPVVEVRVQALTDEPSTRRVAGDDRFATAIQVSQEAFPHGAEVVYLANGATFVDAVVGGALTRGPVLLVEQCGLPDGVAEEVDRLSPGEVVALGGAAAICDDVLAAFDAG